MEELDAKAYAHVMAERTVLALDVLPAPRHMINDKFTGQVAQELHQWGKVLASTRVEANVTAFVLGEYSPDDITKGAVWHLRYHDQRVGPFRKRKIRKLIDIALDND
jgi:hypothetical protein